jgi:hypothetical protein
MYNWILDQNTAEYAVSARIRDLNAKKSKIGSNFRIEEVLPKMSVEII